MRRKTDTDILKENIGTFIWAALFFIIGLLLPFLPLFNTVAYDELIEKEITVESAKSIVIDRGRSVFRIISSDGERYFVRGAYASYAKLRDALPSGTQATIKYYKNPLAFFENSAEEIVVNGKYIAEYNDDKDDSLLPRCIFAGISMLLGVFPLLIVRWEVKHNRRLQQNRDRRILKKYGHIKDRSEK